MCVCVCLCLCQALAEVHYQSTCPARSGRMMDDESGFCTAQTVAHLAHRIYCVMPNIYNYHVLDRRTAMVSTTGMCVFVCVCEPRVRTASLYYPHSLRTRA